MLEKLFKLIQYENDNINSLLDIKGINIFEATNEILISIFGKTPISIHDMREFCSALDSHPIRAGFMNKYEFTFESFEESDVTSYYRFVIQRLAKNNSRLIPAQDYQVEYNKDTNTLTINVPFSDSSLSLSRNEIESEFKKMGLSIYLYFSIQEKRYDISEQIKKEKEIERKEIVDSQPNKGVDYVWLNEGKELRGTEIDIKDLPDNEYEFIRFKEEQSSFTFIIHGVVKYIDEEAADRNATKFIVDDGTQCIYVGRTNLRKDELKYFDKDRFKVGMSVAIQCYPELSKFTGDVQMRVVNMRHSESIAPITDRVDNEEVKRVELHLHTKMSALDGVPDMSQYLEACKIFGHTGIAITDHGSVQSYHELYEFAKSNPSFKPIYGVELNYVDEDTVVPAFEPKDIYLDDATYVVFDFETTGFSVNYERVIEISAVKVKNGIIIDQFSELVNPEKQIPTKVVELTGISNADVSGARKRKEVLADFKKFIEGSILVAHNAKFDIGHLYSNFDELGFEYEKYPVIDTFILAKILFPGHKAYNLDALSKLLGVSLKNHHRALDDASATGDIFIHMLTMLRKQGIMLHSEINNIVDRKEVYKYPISKHINLIAKTQTGLRNLYHILSIASTESLTDDPTVTKDLLERYREGILVGSGCRNSYFFDIALLKSTKEMENIISFYDYIELQPLNSFSYYNSTMDNYRYCITDTMKRIITVAKKHNIPVVATGDCHQVNREDTIYRKILADTPSVGRQRSHYLKRDVEKEEEFPAEYYMTTREMLDEFAFLGEELAYEIVVKNTNLIADACDFVQSFTNNPYPPKDDFMKERGIDSAEVYVNETVYNKAKELYGDLLPGVVLDRIKQEMDSITKNKFSTLYLIARLLVHKSRDDGYVVGSRGSVGSSFIAYLLDITEVNSLPPHFRCPKCHFSTFKMTAEQKTKYGLRNDEKELNQVVEKVLSGYDLPITKCPICGCELDRDGHDIPFETFLGVPSNPKTPDIDLNFSGENQGDIHNYIREIFGYTKAYRAGTILTAQRKTAYAIVNDYFNNYNEKLAKNGLPPQYHRKAEIEALANQIYGVKKTSSQHPGGIVVVPSDHEIYDVTPVQYPGDSKDKSWMITHFDYHSFEKNLFKLDVLGHDDPTVIRYLMQFVKEKPELFPFDNPFDIPVNDSNVYQMLNNTKCIGVTPDEILSTVASYGISEVGTSFVRGLLEEAKPKTFAELVKVSGFSHGTDVWRDNAEALLLGNAPGMPKIPFNDLIGCRDDIMTDLISFGVPSDLAFKVMEFVRKGNAPKQEDKWHDFVEQLEQYPVPKWYIWSCSKIKYMFPKAHATAYVIMAMRIAWFKLYRPIYFYSAVLSKKCTQYNVEIMSGGIATLKPELERLKALPNKERKAKEDDLITTYEIALEMCSRGYKFLGIDLYHSKAADFAVSEDGQGLYMPFTAIDGLGQSVAESIISAREEKPFSTKSDFKDRTRVSSTIYNTMEYLDVFHGMQEDAQMSLDLEF